MEFTLISQDEFRRCVGVVGTQPEHSYWTLTPYLGGLIKEFWNGSDWIESASEQEISLFNKIIVPDTISRMGLKIQLLLNGITIDDIIETINSIPSYMFPEQQKQIAIIKFQEAAYFDRYNADLQLIATLMGLTQEDLDTMFINGNNIT